MELKILQTLIQQSIQIDKNNRITMDLFCLDYEVLLLFV
jgi:hypothetical protein